MTLPDVEPGDTVVAAACWSCGTQVYQTISRHRLGWLRWSCTDCAVTWAAPPELPRRGLTPAA